MQGSLCVRGIAFAMWLFPAGFCPSNVKKFNSENSENVTLNTMLLVE